VGSVLPPGLARASSGALTDSGGALAASGFGRPAAQAKPMARTWFPDAGAGGSAAGLALVAKQFTDQAAAGFGGAEIAFLSDNTHYVNADAQTIGFGSENWRRILKQILRTANGIPDGFKIDLTLSSHWPVATNNIDPNDDAQQQQLADAYAKITAADLASGTKNLPLPPQRTRDVAGGFGGGDLTADFLFVDKFVAATLAKVTGFSGSTPVFQLASLADATARTARQTVTDAQAAAGTPYHEVNGVKYAGYAAGIPDQAYAAAHGIDYSKVLAQWGPEPADPSFPGKIDADGNRRRMADWQYLYQTGISGVPALAGYTPSSGDGLAVGDFVLFGSYREGTGQVMSGGASITQYNRSHVVSIYDTAGVRAIADFWQKNILDAEMIGLLRANAARNPSDAVFEDSLEVSHTGPLWALGLFEAITSAAGYAAATYAPLFALGSAASFDDTATAGRILEDYVTAMAAKYENEHIAGIEKWAATFGFMFKAQAEAGATGVAGGEASLGVTEGDNGAVDDGFRNLAAAANMGGTNLVSNESLTFVAVDYTTPWLPLAAALNSYWGPGVNRVNYHGSPFPKTFNDYHDSWPGWDFALGPSALGVFDARQIYWGDMGQLSGYVARTQAVLQGGRPNVDLAVLEGTDARYQLPSGNSLQGLLNAGYSYNILDEAMLELPAAKVTGGVLAARGPAYRALIVSQATILSVAAVRKLIRYAAAGLPVILYNSPITRVFGAGTATNNDTILAEQVAALKSLGNVSVASTEDEIIAILSGAGIGPVVSYSVPGLVSIGRSDSGADYYLLWSEGTTLASPAAQADTGIRVVSTAGLRAGDQILIDTGAATEVATIASIPSPAPASGPNILLTAPLAKPHAGPASSGFFFGATLGAGVSAAVGKKVTLSGSGTPYTLDAWTGQIAPLAEYTADRDTVTFELTLGPQAAALVALRSLDDGGGATIHATGASGGQVLYVGRKLVHRATAAGTYTVALSDGRTRTFTVPSPPAAPALAAGWNLSLESWGPDAAADAANPSISAKTTVTFDNIALGTWQALPATASQLAALGVASMSQVSGIGTYATQFVLPATWTRADGAYLQLAHGGGDMVVAVSVNGQQLDTIDPFTDRLDVGAFLRPGGNSITVRIDTTFNNRVGKAPQSYGLTGAQLIPYVQTAL
jgi:hypothetical protein